ncbi:MAG: sodium:solute symporter family protein [Cyanobacteria bacterium SZAS LIN-2]|nr:sodium:solute symporter family protein [Cyanobacteria bacterium SZAS LIN-3]MBS1999730.1 sodium:solute symporter family protein [Cyanobacteria bacterium SZAS LIN-2]MBS2007613.1 sodium:solute symporter family protein [Cyanobacteria bacterium SZAS TMP-1]
MKSSKDFLQAGAGIPSWVTGLAFLSANLGAIEVMGMAANGAQYGMMTCHFYWLGAIPAMVFVAVFMMPFYYKSNIRSVPEYLRKRFNEPTRALNAISFAVMTVLMSGINLYAMALVFQSMLGWDMNWSILMAAGVVLAYTITGGLTSSIYNEVMQFFLIFFGLMPVTIMGILRLGDWNDICARFQNPGFAHLWLEVPGAKNPMGADFLGLIAGLGFVLSFGYWCTDFLVIQRALAARDLKAAQMTPIIAAFPKILFPILTVFPGLLAIIFVPALGSNNTNYSYNMAIPILLSSMYPSGLLGLGITALLASFMSGMAGNVTAFNTVWTFDIYQSYIAKNKSDAHYLWMGKAATAGGILISVATAYLVMNFNSIMDYMQLIFTFFNAPLFATFALGMFFKRTTGPGAFIGLLCGTIAAAYHYGLTLNGKLIYRSQMISNFHGAVVAFTVCLIVTVVVSYLTKPKAESELKGLCMGVREGSMDGAAALQKESIFSRPGFWGIILLAVTVWLNLLFY